MITANLIGGFAHKGRAHSAAPLHSKNVIPAKAGIQTHGSPLTTAGMTALVLVLSSALSFAAGPGTTTAELLKIPVGARAIGMGEAFTAAAEDSSALAWNPAGLSFATRKEASFMHSSLLESVHYEHLAFVSPGSNYSVGASMAYLGYGSISGYDASDRPIGDQSAYSFIFTGGIATYVYNRLSLGMAASVLREKLASASAGTFAANLGALYEAPFHAFQSDYRFGLSVLNLGPGLKFIDERDPLPRKIKLGAAVAHVKEWPLNFTTDITIPNDNSAYVSLGSEYWFHDMVALRLGYAGSNDEGKGVRVGMGIKLRGLLFDYAYGGFGDFGATHRVGFTFQWGERTKQLNREQRAVLKEAKKASDHGDYTQQILVMDDLLRKDPTNDRVLKQMITAHQNMLQKELKDAVAKGEEKDVPSPEEYALQDLVPGQQAVVKGSGYDPKDPLDLNNLPDASHLDLAPTVEQGPAAVPAPSAASPVETQPAAPSTSVASPPADGVLLNPSDIYGQ